MPINAETREQAARSLYDIHNQVTANLGAAVTVPPFEEWYADFQKSLDDGRLPPEQLMQGLWDLLFGIALSIPLNADDLATRQKNLGDFVSRLPWASSLITGPESASTRAWTDAVKALNPLVAFADRETTLVWLMNVLDRSTDVTPPWWATGSFVGESRGPISQFGNSVINAVIQRYEPAIATAQVRVGVGKKAFGCR